MDSGREMIATRCLKNGAPVIIFVVTSAKLSVVGGGEFDNEDAFR
jgi:hypothetical protein